MGKKKKKRIKSECCERYKDGRKPCKGCPTVSKLIKKRIKKLMEQYRED